MRPSPGAATFEPPLRKTKSNAIALMSALGVTWAELTVQKTMLPVATTGAMLKSPETPTGVMPGLFVLMPRMVTVRGASAALLPSPVPLAYPASRSCVPDQIDFGMYHSVAVV